MPKLIVSEPLITKLDELLFHQPNTIVRDLTEAAGKELDALLTTKRLDNVHRNLQLGMNDYLFTLGELQTQFDTRIDKTLA
jgi:hypothetical protein